MLKSENYCRFICRCQKKVVPLHAKLKNQQNTHIMSTRERNRKIKWMEDFEAQMMAKGKRPSKAWLMAKTTQGSITINDPAYML